MAGPSRSRVNFLRVDDRQAVWTAGVLDIDAAGFTIRSWQDEIAVAWTDVVALEELGRVWHRIGVTLRDGRRIELMSWLRTSGRIARTFDVAPETLWGPEP
jgi:hypothetical protein